MSLEPDWCHNIGNEKEHKEDVVEVNFVHSWEEYCNENQHVKICDKYENNIEQCRTIFSCQSLQKPLFLFIPIEIKVFLALNQEKERWKAQHHEHDLNRWDLKLKETEREPGVKALFCFLKFEHTRNVYYVVKQESHNEEWKVVSYSEVKESFHALKNGAMHYPRK